MKLIIAIVTMFLSAQVLGHPDHAMGDSPMHEAYHLVFWGLIGAIAFGVYQHLSKRQKNTNDKDI